jgi:hypothetical protein
MRKDNGWEVLCIHDINTSFVLTQMSQFLQKQKQAFYVHQLWLGIQSSWGFSPIDAIS